MKENHLGYREGWRWRRSIRKTGSKEKVKKERRYKLKRGKQQLQGQKQRQSKGKTSYLLSVEGTRNTTGKTTHSLLYCYSNQTSCFLKSKEIEVCSAFWVMCHLRWHFHKRNQRKYTKELEWYKTRII